MRIAGCFEVYDRVIVCLDIFLLFLLLLASNSVKTKFGNSIDHFLFYAPFIHNAAVFGRLQYP